MQKILIALALIMGCAFTAQAQTAADSVLIIKNRGIAGIRLGMKMSKVPKSIPGLYTAYDERREGTELNCTDLDGDWVMIITDDDENEIIDGIYIRLKGVKIEGTDIEVGVPLSKFANIPDLVKSKEQEGSFIYKKLYEIQLDQNDIVYAIYIHLIH